MKVVVGSFSFAAIEQRIKNPARGGAKYYLVPGIEGRYGRLLELIKK